MISVLSGTVLQAQIDSLVVGVGGVGITVMCSPSLVAQAIVDGPITLHTSLIVREDSLTLFGFENVQSREMFDLIQSVSGFGPKLAFTIVASMSSEQLSMAIGQADQAALTRIPGVGAKGASRLILELRDRFPQSGSEQSAQSWRDPVHAAVTGLGWSSQDATRAIAVVAAQFDAESDVAAVLKATLTVLGQT